MVDVALQGGINSGRRGKRPRQVLQRLRLSDAVFRHLTRIAAVMVLVILTGIIIALVHGSLPALRKFGFSFLVTESLESGDREIRRPRADLRHARHLASSPC